VHLPLACVTSFCAEGSSCPDRIQITLCLSIGGHAAISTGKKRDEACEERYAEAMIWKLLRPLELALLAVIGAVEWVVGWVERQSTPMKLGLGMLLGVAATMTVAAIYARLR
jgi:hypothetical protein